MQLHHSGRSWAERAGRSGAVDQRMAGNRQAAKPQMDQIVARMVGPGAAAAVAAARPSQGEREGLGPQPQEPGARAFPGSAERQVRPELKGFLYRKVEPASRPSQPRQSSRV